MPEKGETVYLEFAHGKYIVDVGEYHGIPAVFIADAAMPGKVGAPAARDGHPLDKLQPNERVLTFPTTRQAKAVRDALVNLAADYSSHALTAERVMAERVMADEANPAVEVAPARDGHYALWGWFGCSRASWVTLPRVLMHEMPDDWQGRMADLLKEFDAVFPNWCGDMQFYVQARKGRGNGRLTTIPEALCNYRYPHWDEIDEMRKDPWVVEEKA